MVLVAMSFLLVAQGAHARPVLYYLKDDALGPANDGLLNATPPDSENGSLRFVPATPEAFIPVQFLTEPGAANPGQLRGICLVGLWIDKNVVLHGNLTAILYAVTDSEATPIADASAALDLDPEQAPDPTNLIPPDPTNPEAAVFYIAAQALPLLLKPPVLLNFGILDIQLDNDTQLALGLRFDPGSSPAPAPVGAGATIQYDATLTPSFAYVPWYTPPPPRSSPNPTTRAPTSPIGTGNEPGDSDAGGSSPGLGPLLVAFAAAAALAMARRRR